MQQHGIILSHLTMTVGNEFFLEPAFYWQDEITPLHRKSLGDDVVGPWLDRPANLPAREAVIALRKGIQQVYLGLGGVNWQIGRDYPLQQVMQPETWALLTALKHALDPQRPDEPGLARPARAGLSLLATPFGTTAMGFTITEKILARAAGLPFVKAGDEIMAKPDFVIAYDFPGYTDVYLQADEGGLRHRRRWPSPSASALHRPHGPGDRRRRKKSCTRARATGARDQRRAGATSARASATRSRPKWATPRRAPSSCTSTATSASSAPSARWPSAARNVLEAFVMETVSITRAATTVQIDLTGTLQPGVMARDVFHHMVRVLGPASCRFQVIELAARSSTTCASKARQTICGQAMFIGAITAIVNPDAKTLAYALPRARKIELEPVYSDADAIYAARHTIDVSTLEPIVVIAAEPGQHARPRRTISAWRCTPATSARAPAADSRTCASRPTCCAGARSSRASSSTSCRPSQAIMVAAAKEGLIAILVEAGAFVVVAVCDYCFGRIATMTPGQRAVSTGTLNMPGRMGSADSEIYLCNAAVVAASAIEGSIADPRPYLQG